MITTIFSSGGDIEINEDGTIARILASEPGDEYDLEWQKFARFDVAEFLKFWGRKKLPSHIDIVDIGVWSKDGSYDAAEPQWRADAKAKTAPGETRITLGDWKDTFFDRMLTSFGIPYASIPNAGMTTNKNLTARYESEESATEFAEIYAKHMCYTRKDKAV